MSTTNIYEDNLVYIVMSTNPVRHKSSHLIDIHVHFFREFYAAGVMYLIPDSICQTEFGCVHSFENLPTHEEVNGIQSVPFPRLP
jgi:hypothetical protein